MPIRPLVLATLLALAGTPLDARAQLTPVHSPAEFGARPFTVHDFERSTGGPGATYAALFLERLAGRMAAEAAPPSGDFGLATPGGGAPLAITFATPVRAFGLWFGNDDPLNSESGMSGIFPVLLQAFDGTGLIGSVSVLSNGNDLADQFIGFTSTVDVTAVALVYGQGSGVLMKFVDDVQFGLQPMATPEPGTVALVGLGLALAGLGARRRRSR